MTRISIIIVSFYILFGCGQPPSSIPEKPNVIIILTDDQGYGDLSAHGNPWLKTPNMDQLHSESVRFTDFHVGTTCSPSRASILTGKYSNRAGAWHTIMARHMVWQEETLLPEIFQKSGYATGMFGKWHLGDNYPYRPQDRGFDETLMHAGGGIGNSQDYWNNDYFDDTYFRNGEPEKQDGYCSDVWFDSALEFIEQKKDDPFFLYLATNAPHGPFVVDTTYSNPYQKEEITNPEFYGMIANLDENLGRLRTRLSKLGIADNTILVFMTDNGTARGCDLDENLFVTKGYNAGMRGRKVSPYEGGHRVPFFIHWPNGSLTSGRDVETLAGAIDIVPTLTDLCGLSLNNSNDLDGRSLRPLIYQEGDWTDRILFADTQREDTLVKYKQYSIMTEQWRLVNGELYDILEDAGQRTNLSADHPQVVDSLMAAYESWWDHTTIRKDDYTYVPIGPEIEEQLFTQHDIHPIIPGGQAWNQRHVRFGLIRKGYWAVEIETPGNYQLELRRWPRETGLKLGDFLPEGDLLPQGPAYDEGKALDLKKAIVTIAGQTSEVMLKNEDESGIINMNLPAGKFKLTGYFVDGQGLENSAYYLYASLND